MDFLSKKEKDEFESKNKESIYRYEENEILNNKEVLNSSNLELLLPLQILHKLDEENIVNEEMREVLWQLSLNK